MKQIEEYLATHIKYFEAKVPKEAFKCIIKLSEEVGEVSEAALALFGSESKSRKIRKSGQEPIDRLKEELGDVLVVVSNIAKSFGISPEELFDSANKKMTKRMS